MRRLGRYFLIICFIAGVFFLAERLVLPFIYRMIEPRFLAPTVAHDEISSSEDLAIRNDNYGEGAFGAKRKSGRIHKGIDLAAKMKSPVYASKSGWAKTYFVPGGYGNLVIINHPGPYETRYGHLDSFAIKKFQWVRQGDIIGFVGKTGNADARGMLTHLHFEIRTNGEPVDPATELLKRRIK